CALASLRSRRARPPGATAAANSAPGTAGTVTAARAGEPRPQSRRAVLGAEQVVAGAVDLRPGRGGRADQQCVRAGVAAGRAVAEGLLWLRYRGGQSVRGATADGGSHLSAARPAGAGLLGSGGGSGAPGDCRAVAAPSVPEDLNSDQSVSKHLVSVDGLTSRP